MSPTGSEFFDILKWLLPALTLAFIAIGIFWFRLFADIGVYSNWRKRAKRRRWRWWR